MNSWYDNDAFWEDTAPVVFNRERWENATTDVEGVVSLLHLQPSAAILDLCCGPGRHALRFARKGFQVTGVDRSAGYLARARQQAATDGLNVEWVHADMRDFQRPGAFDAVVNLLTSFGYFDDPADERRVLQNVLASLKLGGSLLIELMGREVLARIFRERDWHAEPDGTMLIEERTIRDDWAWVDVRWIILREDRRSEHRFGLRLYSAPELKWLLEQTGFKNVQAFGSLSGKPYDHQAERLVVTAQRAASAAAAP